MTTKQSIHFNHPTIQEGVEAVNLEM